MGNRTCGCLLKEAAQTPDAESTNAATGTPENLSDDCIDSTSRKKKAPPFYMGGSTTLVVDEKFKAELFTILQLQCSTPTNADAFTSLREESDALKRFNRGEQFDDAPPQDVEFVPPTENSGVSGTFRLDTNSFTVEAMDEYLKLSGVSMMRRNGAKQVFKKSSSEQEISNDGDTFMIVTSTPIGSETMEFIVDGPSFEGHFGMEKEYCYGEAKWDSGALVIRLHLSQRTLEQRRWIENNELHQIDMVTSAEGAEGKNKSASLQRAFKRVA